jgi:hypothetical protein
MPTGQLQIRMCFEAIADWPWGCRGYFFERLCFSVVLALRDARRGIIFDASV